MFWTDFSPVKYWFFEFIKQNWNVYLQTVILKYFFILSVYLTQRTPQCNMYLYIYLSNHTYKPQLYLQSLVWNFTVGFYKINVFILSQMVRYIFFVAVAVALLKSLLNNQWVPYLKGFLPLLPHHFLLVLLIIWNLIVNRHHLEYPSFACNIA